MQKNNVIYARTSMKHFCLFLISNRVLFCLDESPCLHIYVVQNWTKMLELVKDDKYFVETRERLKLFCGTYDILSRHTDCGALS